MDFNYMHQALPWKNQVNQKISDALGETFLGMRPELSHPQAHGFTCGTLALIHMAQQLNLLYAVDDEQVLCARDWLFALQDQPAGLYAGEPDDCHQQLMQLLQDKGVPAQSTDDRATMITSKLGLRHIQAILKAKNAWADIKTAGSKPGSMFRLIDMEEQKQYIAERAKTKHGAKIQNHRSKMSQKSSSVHLPTTLRMMMTCQLDKSISLKSRQKHEELPFATLR